MKDFAEKLFGLIQKYLGVEIIFSILILIGVGVILSLTKVFELKRKKYDLPVLVLYVGAWSILAFFTYNRIDTMRYARLTEEEMRAHAILDSLQKLPAAPSITYSIDSICEVIENIAAEDANGRKAIFDIGIMMKDYSWKQCSYEIGGFSVCSDAEKKRLSRYFLKRFQDRINASKAIVCIGNASYENAETNYTFCEAQAALEKETMDDGLLDRLSRKVRKINVALEENEEIANKRAHALTSVFDLMGNTIPLYAMVIGKGRIGHSKKEQRLQRSVVVIYIKKLDDDMDLKPALVHAIMALKDGMPFRIENFSQGTIESCVLTKLIN